MSRAKIIKKTLKDQNLVNMFNQMIGGEGDPEIVARKETELKSIIRIVVGILQNFATGPMKNHPDAVRLNWCKQFSDFATSCSVLLDLPYKQIKEHNQTKQLILICRELLAYAKFLQPPNLSDKWVLDHPGMQFEPFAFTTLDVKMVWNLVIDKQQVAKQYMLQVISLLYNKCYEIYKITTSPDIDVKKFSRVIIDSIDRIRDRPELNRCREAFQKIKESVSLLEDNFTDYYKDMIQSENPNTIIENFIVDVSKGQNMDIKLLRQFRTILGFYQKQSGGKVKDPNVKKLFETLNSRMDMMEKKVTKPPQSDTKVDDDSSDTE